MENAELYELVLQLTNADMREAALLELSRKREKYPDLAPILWHSFGTMSALVRVNKDVDDAIYHG